MVRAKKTVVKRELVFALLVLVIFISLLITWTVVSNVEEDTVTVDQEEESYEDNTGAKVNIEILPNPETEEGSTWKLLTEF